MSLPGSLIDHICKRRDAIMMNWLQALWNSPEFSTAKHLPGPELMDHLPALFDQLADYLRFHGEPHSEHLAREHGRHRWGQQFRLDEVLREILLVRKVIFEEIQRCSSEQNVYARDVLDEARQKISRFFDQVLLNSASQFSEQQQRQIEADRMLIADQHQAAHGALRAIDAARLRLLRTISHELRNLLNAAVFTTTNLSATEDPQRRAEMQEMLRRNHQRMITMVNQLLEMAPLLAEQATLRLAPIDMRALAAEQVKLFEPMAASKHLTFRCEPSDALPDVVNDELKLQRIITNLVQNALKYTPAGGSVEVRFEPAEASLWRLTVSDTGIGIPEEHREKIFDEFHRVPGTERQEGAGLGLSIVRQLVSLLRGQIHVESKVGRGSTFSVTLPRNPGEPASPSPGQG